MRHYLIYRLVRFFVVALASLKQIVTDPMFKSTP